MGQDLDISDLGEEGEKREEGILLNFHDFLQTQYVGIRIVASLK
jgi:hypothetical protein